MIRIRNRNDLIAYLENHLTRSLLRALLHKNEFFGAFHPMIAGGTKTGWIVQVTSKTGRSWLIGITPEQKGNYQVHRLNEVPWKNWLGPGLKILSGDHPEKYKLLQQEK